MATMIGTWSGHGAGAWRREARALTALAVPIVLTNVGQVAIQTTDVVMIGWLGPEALAASVLGVNVMFVVLLFSIGVVAATAPMIAQDLGRRRQAVREPRRTVRQGLWVGLALSLPASLVLWHIAPLLHLLRQDPELIAGAESYVRAAMWGFGPALWFVVLRNFIASLERPRAAMVITLIGVSFNAVAAYGLIFGRLGLPALGLCGRGDRRRADQCLAVRRSARLRPDRPAVPPLSRSRAPVAGRLGAFSGDLPDRPADRRDPRHGGRAVRQRRLPHGPDWHGRARRAPDRTAMRLGDLHGATWPGAGRDRARGSGRRRRPCARASSAPASRRWRWAACSCWPWQR